MEVTLTKINKVLESYKLENAGEYAHLTSGFANASYKITTEQGNYLFRICKNKSASELETEIRILEQLKSQGFKAAYPIKQSNNEYIYRDHELGEIIIWDFIEGHIAPQNSETVIEIAQATAKLNQTKIDSSLQRDNPLSIDFCLELSERLKELRPEHELSKETNIIQSFSNEIKELEPKLREKHRQGLVHGDIFPDNTLFQGNKLQAIIDFEECFYGDILFDIGMTIFGFCTIENKLDSKLQKIFADEYSKHMDLSTREQELIPAYIKFAALATMSWHLNKMITEFDSRKLDRVKEICSFISPIQA